MPSSIENLLREFLERDARDRQDGQSLRGLREEMERRFAKLDANASVAVEKLDVLDMKIEAVEEKLEEKLDVLETKIDEVSKGQEKVQEKQSRHNRRISGLEEDKDHDSSHKTIDVEARLIERDAKELAARLERKEENERWMKRAIIGAILSILGSIGAGYAIGHSRK